MENTSKPNHNRDLINQSFHSYAEEHEKIRNTYRVTYKLKKKDLKDFPRGKVGDIIHKNPDIPDTPKEAFELFRNYYAAVQCALQKHLFTEKYKTVNLASVKAEILEIENWIEEAKKENYTEACKTTSNSNQKHEYLRLINGFYDGYLMTWQEMQETSTAAMVYGQYVLFYEYLQSLLPILSIKGSEYITKVEIDFENLPQYVIQQGIVQRFEKTFIRTSYDYKNWQADWGNYLSTIPQEYISKAIQKSIEYGKKVYAYHLKNECQNHINCSYNESWERRIAIAEGIMKDLVTENQQTRNDFSKWIMSYPDWKETAWRFNTGREYQQKQDLIAVFWNSYIYFQQKFEAYFEEFRTIPIDYFEKLIFEFRQKFPKTGRVEGVNYFDDLIEQLIERHQKILAQPADIEPINDVPNDKNKDFTTARQVLAMHFIFDQLQVRNTEIDRKDKANFIEFLTGKNNKNIYDALQDPFSTKQRNFRFDDLHYIRTYFEKLGLSEIVKAINNQLDKPR